MAKKKIEKPLISEKDIGRLLTNSFRVKDGSDEVWDEMPVDIQEFIEGEDYCNQKFDGRRGCRPKIMEIAKRIVDPKVREVVLLLGKGSGKDYISSMILLYCIYRCLCMKSPQKYHYMAPGSAMYFVNVARNENQAKNVFFKEFLGHLESCKWFNGKYEEPASQKVVFDKNLIALSGNSQAYGWLGYNTIMWVGDELAFFLEGDASDNGEGGESKAEECWLAAYGSCQTRYPDHYKMIGITTPRFDDDFVMRKFYELTKQMNEDGTAFTMQAPTWDIHPRLTIEDFKKELERDYRRTMRDFGAIPMGVIETFWGDPDFLRKNVCTECKSCPVYKSCFDDQGHIIKDDPYMCWDYEDCRADAYRGNGEFRNWFVADPDAEYYLHFDLSKNKDKTGFSMSHVIDYVDVQLDPWEVDQKTEQSVKGNKADFDKDDLVEQRAMIKVDFVAWIDPASKRDFHLVKNGEIHYDSILRKIINQLIDKGVQIGKITCDQYQSHMFKQSIEDKGIDTELLSLDRTDEVPVTSKNAITDNRVMYPWNFVLCQEARHLKYINGRKVDHPTGKGKDLIDGFFGCIYNAEKAEAETGSFFSMEEYD